ATAPAASVDRVARIDVARGRDLFYDAPRGFGRCSTCHEVAGLGIPVVSSIATVPATVAALRTLPTPVVATVMVKGDRMPALIVSRSVRTLQFYDLTTPP